MITFTDFFHNAAMDGTDPHDYQGVLVSRWESPRAAPTSLAINAPTGAGKTAAVTLAWLWNRCAISRLDSQTFWPRRLVYCLPMRTLVTQTRQEVDRWLQNLKEASLIGHDVAAFTLMGGNVQEDWELRPEVPAILIGTQDQLLSRGLNLATDVSPFIRGTDTETDVYVLWRSWDGDGAAVWL